MEKKLQESFERKRLEVELEKQKNQLIVAKTDLDSEQR